ncbi:MAG: hypothetical protein IPP81_19160 [Chitinophagaceae bacterium]|nr:hypothetical protein [Chitinophagaceae bacterium]
MKKIVLTLSVIFGCLKVCKAQSFEGYISENIPVWVDLNIPSNAESISGSYFYKKNGVTILLSGTIKGNQIILTEKNKSGLITGIFTCLNLGDSLIGNWRILIIQNH